MKQRDCGVLAMKSRTLVAILIGLVATAGATRSDDATKDRQSAIEVVNEGGKSFSYQLAELAKLPQHEIQAKDHKGETASYSGVAVADLLKQSEVTLGSGLKGPMLANSLLVEAADKYRVTFSLPEVDPDWTDNDVLLATSRNGESLDAAHGPFQLVVPRDKRHGRWVKQVIRLTVRRDSK
jgi:DMSO/TMAO reductase YedYZ molybdopterin-dependent catalytic subunit